MWLHLVAKFINNASGAMGPLWLCSGMVDYGEWLCRKSKVIFFNLFFTQGIFPKSVDFDPNWPLVVWPSPPDQNCIYKWSEMLGFPPDPPQG